MVKELCCAINRDFPQIRREGDDANVIFWWEGLRVFRGGHGTRLIQNVRDVDMCTEFDMFEVKVPIICQMNVTCLACFRIEYSSTQVY